MSDAPKLPRNSLWRELAPGEMLRDEAGQGYRVVRFLAEGGYSQVYEAEREIEPERHPRVALKVLNLKHRKNKKAIRRQLSEAKALYRLNHPNVVRVHGLGMREDTGTVFMVMDLLVGRTMRDLVRDLGGRMPIPWTLEIMISVCRGLSAIHSLAVHRDLKPENIHARDDGHISLFDLGTSRFSKEERLTTQGYTIGTLNYMSPEQLSGERELDGRSDLFAVGTMLYELLTGQNPFAGPGGRRGRQEIGNEIMFRAHVPMNELRAPSAHGQPGKLVASNVPIDLVAIVERLLRKQPADRYKSAALVADLLSAALAKFTFDNQAYPALPLATLGEVPRTREPDEGEGLDESDGGASVPTSTNPFLSVSFPPDEPGGEGGGAPRRAAPSIAYASTEQIATYGLPAPGLLRVARISAEVVDVSDEAESIDSLPAPKPTYRFVGIAKLDRPPVEESGVDAVYMDPDALASSTLSPHAKRPADARNLPTEHVRTRQSAGPRALPAVFLYMSAAGVLALAAVFVLGALGVIGRGASSVEPGATPSATVAPAAVPRPLATLDATSAPTAPTVPQHEAPGDAGAPPAPHPPPTSAPRAHTPPAPSARPKPPAAPALVDPF